MLPIPMQPALGCFYKTMIRITQNKPLRTTPSSDHAAAVHFFIARITADCITSNGKHAPVITRGAPNTMAIISKKPPDS